MENEARRILEFLGLSERLKRELRHSWLSDGRRESVAEHTWQMALVALLAYRHLEHPVDIGRVMLARCLPDRALQCRKGASRGQDGWRRNRRSLDQGKGCREIRPGSGVHLLTGIGAKELAPRRRQSSQQPLHAHADCCSVV